ncbi:AMP-binding protein [Ilumatobacter coccineus]|uniref:Putative 4-coumarate--CoA ligase n=1 Tax=Ilumatobacter coccineus (strain NBRC 103263 / KCTC 29153 / YM16-304) TaxID=1313172 RepID=A0A6C7EA94_ILUCY|nr:AMP-binding protein [Ilumatobacter coccineus]BAN02139.1 putative 4-coumarate--CoA ligase [Ilumatobacter coccineus YM16-304]
MTTIIHPSPLPDVEIPEVTITQHVLRRADELADRVAIRDAAGTSSYTYTQLSAAIHSLAGGLAERGVQPGVVVGLMAPNLPEYAVVFHGVAVAGGAVTTINPTYGPEEVRHQLQDAGATLLFTVGPFVDTALSAIEGTDVTEVIVIGDAAPGTTGMADVFGEPIEQVSVDLATHTVVLPYSSGTTGLPKGVMLTHRNLVANIEQCIHAIKYTDDEVALAALPFFHIYGMQVLMNGLLANGVTTVSMPRFDMVEALTAVQELKITRFFAVPPIILGLAKAPIVGDYDTSSIRQIFSGAAPLGAELAAEAAARLGCEVVQGFGMTELSPVSHCTVEGDYRPGTSGVTVSNTESRIVDPDTGEDRGVGERGELWVRGPQVMTGYLNNPDATAATIDDDGWLHTGDVAIIDEFGHMTIVDRLKELIKFKGFQVAPAELEALIITHPKVADVAVIGVPDDEAGEVPKAFVSAVPGETITLDEIQALVSEHLVSYKQIQQLEVVEAIPKSAAGKILRKELRGR